MEKDNENSALTEVQSYIKSEWDVFRFKAAKRVSLIGGSVLLTVCVLFLSFLTVVFLAIGGTLLLAECVPMWAAFLITAGVFLFLIAVLLLCKKILFVNPIVRVLTDSKNLDELEKDTLRAEGYAALLRERLKNRVNAIQTAIEEYIRLFRLGIKLIHRIFVTKSQD